MDARQGFNTIQNEMSIADMHSTLQSTTNDIRSMLWDYNKKLSKHDMYFRNQDRLMRNAIIPPQEIKKINEKYQFQTKHSDILSVPNPRNIRKKYEGVSHSPISLSQQTSYSKFGANKDVSAHKSNQSTQKNLKALIRARPSLDDHQPISLILSQNNTIEGPTKIPRHLSKNLQSHFNSSLLKTQEMMPPVKDALSLGTKKKLKPLEIDQESNYKSMLAKKLQNLDGLF
jgi:hypothetical protein